MITDFAGATRVLAVAIACTICAGAAIAEEPAPHALALAKELIVLKGSTRIWDSVVPGVIEQAKGVYMQTNPALSRELNDVAGQLRTELAPRGAQLSDEVASLYAQAFSEQELAQAVAFYKTPLGKKIVREEPGILDEGVRRIQQWRNKFSEEVMIRMRAEMKKKGYDL